MKLLGRGRARRPEGAAVGIRGRNLWSEPLLTWITRSDYYNDGTARKLVVGLSYESQLDVATPLVFPCLPFFLFLDKEINRREFSDSSANYSTLTITSST